jgi:hypothetical protein
VVDHHEEDGVEHELGGGEREGVPGVTGGYVQRGSGAYLFKTLTTTCTRESC